MPPDKVVVVMQCHCTMRSFQVHIFFGWDGLIGLPLIGGLYHIQQTSTHGSQWNAPYQRTLSCCKRTLSIVGLKKLPLFWRTLSSIADFDRKGSHSPAPCWRTLSHEADFNHSGSQETTPCWRTLSWKDFNHSTGCQDVTVMKSQDDKVKSKASDQQVNHNVRDLPERWKILHWMLGQCYDGNCVWLLTNGLIRRVVSPPQCMPIWGLMSLVIILAAFNDKTFVFDQLRS